MTRRSEIRPRRPSALMAWRDDAEQQPRRRGQRAARPVGPLPFAFYARLSTKEHQDPDSSCQWQRECASDVIADAGTVVAEYLDVGCSRRRAWPNRPQASRLLAAVSLPARSFDAVAVGEYERAFAGRQVFTIAELLREHAVQLWLPETLGPVDLDDPAHRAVLIELGARSMREVQRARRRATEAMRVQTRDQGRYLGGRPPYGYRLVPAGPHPTASHARWGRHQLRLDPDPVTAAHVRWIFAQRLQGRSMSSIARDLNQRSVPCPSAHDQARNSHRHTDRWAVTTIAAILGNPRYTGRQVWNRQPAEHKQDTATGSKPSRNSRREWVISRRPAHPGLVDESDFVAAQAVSAVARPADGSPRRYRLVGVLRCAACGRRMTSHWANGRAWYRCRHGGRSSAPTVPGTPRGIYLREDRLLHDLETVLRGSPAGKALLDSDVGASLRNHGLIGVCDHQGLTLEKIRRDDTHSL